MWLLNGILAQADHVDYFSIINKHQYLWEALKNIGYSHEAFLVSGDTYSAFIDRWSWSGGREGPFVVVGNAIGKEKVFTLKN